MNNKILQCYKYTTYNNKYDFFIVIPNMYIYMMKHERNEDTNMAKSLKYTYLMTFYI